MHNTFLEAIREKRIVEITFDSNEKGIITRTCVPFDFGPSRRYKDGLDRYHFFDLDSPDGSHNLSILIEQLTQIRLLEQYFDPAQYVTWAPKWFVNRDWGKFS